ncbi:MAG TPA: hypothetical protein VFI44_01410 [Ornithinibacter sp.]|nr:hypothetical protein [Ornithinibacter sp.]
MRLTDLLAVRAEHLAARVLGRAQRRAERGDVPGWVLITLMTAGIVTALWVVAKEQLISMFQSAMSSVKG